MELLCCGRFQERRLVEYVAAPPFAERLTRLSLELGRLEQALRAVSVTPAVVFRQRLTAIQQIGRAHV